MKTTLTILSMFLLLTTTANSQMVSNIPLSEIDAEYIKLNAGYRPGKKIVVHLDFGQVDQVFNMKDRLITNNDGSPLEFNSMMHALNYLSQQGYELFNIFSAGTDGNMDPFYIMKRKEQKVN